MKNGKKIKRTMKKTYLKNKNDNKKIILQLLDDAYLYHFKQFSKYDSGKQILKGIFKSFTKHYLYKVEMLTMKKKMMMKIMIVLLV